MQRQIKKTKIVLYDKKNKNTDLLADHNVYVVFIYNLIQKMGVDDQFTSFISMAFVFF
jgi:hypothetical protein